MNLLWIIDKELDITLDKTVLIEMIKNLRKHLNIYIATNFRKEKIKLEGVENIYYFPSFNVRYIKRLAVYVNQVRYFDKIFKESYPDILLFNSRNYFLLKKALSRKEKHSIRNYLDIRTLPVWSARYKNLLESFFLRRCLKLATVHFDGVTYITEEMKKHLEKKYNLPPHKFEMWSSGVNSEIFKPTNNVKKHEPFRIIYHGDLGEKRRISNVIKALKILKEFEIEFFILGSRKGFVKLYELGKTLGLSNRIIVHEPVSYDKVPKYINRADVGIIPLPKWPGWNVSSPIKLFEYLSCGLPVIATRIPAHLNLLEGKEFVFWADSASPEDLAEAIKLAYENKEHFQTLGCEARKFVVDNYTWKEQANRLSRFITS